MKKHSIDLKNLKKEVRLDYYKSSGPGGQHKNKTMSCVRLYHKTTGIRVVATESRSQIKNKELILGWVNQTNIYSCFVKNAG